jgi:hypothetical protein
LARNLVKPLLSLYGTEWRERGYGLRGREEGKGKAGGGRERGEEEWGVGGRGSEGKEGKDEGFGLKYQACIC